jgi:hypothetical protein
MYMKVDLLELESFGDTHVDSTVARRARVDNATDRIGIMRYSRIRVEVSI